MRKSIALLLLACSTLHAQDTRFSERFANPETRDASLADLVPGTDEFHFHTALAHQLAGRDAEFKAAMATWKTAMERKENRLAGENHAVLENRQLLMDYQKDPVGSLSEIIRKLDLRFDYEQPDAAAVQNLPTKLDPAKISEEIFEELARKEAPDKPYTRFSGTRLAKELDEVGSFDKDKVEWMLGNTADVDHPGIVPLMDRALELNAAFKFPDDLVTKLTSSQLETLFALHPDLKHRQSFVRTYLEKLRPGSETDFERDIRAHAAHLRKCRDFVIPLSPVFNSLKAHVLFHHLRLQQTLDNYPEDDFLAYLALPRQGHPLVRNADESMKYPVGLSEDFEKATGCPPVKNDVPLIDAYLEHFLGQADSAERFTPHVKESQLRKTHARARLLAGGDPSRWATGLDAAEFKELQDKIQISFPPSPDLLPEAESEVSIPVDLKNTPDLLIRIYELDLPGHLANHRRMPDVSLDLDGLVPHVQRRLAFAQAPLIRHRESIALPELAGAGVWIVEFTSGQVSARALIRKGQLIPFIDRTSTGQTVLVFDEKGNHVPTAILTLGTEVFAADAAGKITIPNTSGQPVTDGTVSAGKLAERVSLGSREDKVELETRFHLDREQLLADQETKVQLRVRLTNHGHELPLDRIQNPVLVLHANLAGGVAVQRIIASDLKLAPTLEVPFRVPSDLRGFWLTLGGTVQPTTSTEPQQVRADDSFFINHDLDGDRIATVFFSPTADGHRLEIRGRNGEPLPSRSMLLRCEREDFQDTADVEVRTDENGRVDLGTLEGITSVTVKGIGQDPSYNPQYKPIKRAIHHGDLIQIPAGREIRLPLERPLATADRLHLGLLETLDEKPMRDHSGKLAVENDGLVVRGLEAGDYQLRMHDKKTTIRVSSGVEREGLLISPARIMPLLIPEVPHTVAATVENQEVSIKLSGTTPTTRVSLVGKRYHFPIWGAGQAFTPFSPALPDRLIPGFSGNEFITHRLLDDETRYILDRRSAKTFPGSMLPRPGPLVNRWTEEIMEQESYDTDDGESGEKSSFGKTSSGGSSGPGGAKYLTAAVFDACDFLQFPASVRFDLTPAVDGTIKVPLADFEGCQFIEIMAVDTFANDRTILALPPSDTPLRDRRIARTLDSASHHLATRSAAVLAKGAEASIENLLDADWRAFTTLAEAHNLLNGMTGAEALREFTFITAWPDLKEDKKLEHLQTHACHELHLFLYRKDRPFFEKYVKPLLAMKSEPKFMDDYLLERDLSGYLRPYAWHRLNAAEKALLARAMPDARERIAKELSLRWQLEAPAPDVETMLFTRTLRGTDLAVQDSLGMARNDNAASGMIVKTFQLPPDFMNALDASSAGALSNSAAADPFAGPSSGVLARPSASKSASELLKQHGIHFMQGSSAVFSPGGKLTITNSAHEINRVEKIIQAVGGSDRRSALPTPLAAGFDDIVADVPNSVGYSFGSSIDGIPADPFASNGITNGLRLGDPAINRHNVDAILDNRSRAWPRSTYDLGSKGVSAGVHSLPRKLERIIIPEIDFKDIPIQGAVDFLMQQAKEHDSEELDPAKKGVKISIRKSGWTDPISVKELRVKNIPLQTALKYICEQTKLRFKVDDFGVTLVPATEAGDNSFTRSFKISPEFLALLSESGSASDPVVASLKNQGINFAEGSSATVSNGILLVTNAAEELDKIEQLIEAVTPSTARTTPVPFAEQTFLWKEANYYHHSGSTDEELIPLNRFWLDLALWDGKGPFLSASFNACHTNANEALMCLAMLDLPFKADRPEVVVDGSTLRVIAREPMLLFYKDTRRTEAVAKESPLLLRQTFSPKAEPFRTVDGEQVENTVTGDFRPGVAYSALLVVTNPTGTSRRIDLLAQIPAGSIPLGGEPSTKSTTHQLEPYGVVKETLAFYFPATGEFPVYPLQVSQGGTILGHTAPRTMRVSNDPAPQDAASWGVLAVEGTDQEVLDRLAVENLDTVELKDILWRLKKPEFFLAATKLLRERLHYSPSVSAFGFLHNDLASMRDYLENSEATTQLGSWLDSPLLEIRPRTHGDAEWQEFDPLVNSRAHAFGDHPRMENPDALDAYEEYLDRLKWKPALDAEDLFGQTYFLLLQDRIEEALAHFDKIDATKLPGRLNYDYLRAVVLFHRENPQEAKAIATENLPNLPPGLWRDRFQTVIDQANEIAALDQQQASPEAEKPEPAPILDLATAPSGSLLVKHRSPDKTTLRLFSVDLEVLFSKNPFLDIHAGTSGRPAISANSTLTLEPSAVETETAVEIPTHLRTGNLLISAESPTRKVLKVLGSEAMEIRRNTKERTVQVLDVTTRKPLGRTYIKVYTEDKDGNVAFHKDGYTDLRGKFDYLSHTGKDASGIRRVAILASHPEKGARSEIHTR